MTDFLNEEYLIQQKTKPRNVFAAFLLSLILPGFGQVYNGQLKKGMLFFGLCLLNPLIFGFTRAATYFYGFVALCLIELLLRIYIIVDAIKNAKRQTFYIPKKYNAWYYQLLLAMCMVAILWMYDTRSITGIQSFHIPTSSNQPTLFTGDYLIADIRAYKKEQPGYGDIVVYKRNNDQLYTFRIAGLPKDTLDIIDNIVTINREQSKSTFIKDTISDDFRVSEFEEEFPNGRRHKIYKSKPAPDSTKSNIMNIIVPDNSYYVLGDNRDNAADSRYEGFVNRAKIVGKVIYSYWGKTTSRINLDFRKN